MSNEPDKIIYSMIRVSKRHGQREVLKDISLSYFYGAKIGVLGLNGSGKSSLLKILAGVDQSFEGKTVLAPGYTIGYLEQEPLVNEMRTVREVVEEGAQVTSVTLSGAEMRIGAITLGSGYSINLVANGDTSGITVLQDVGLVVYGANLMNGEYNYTIDFVRDADNNPLRPDITVSDTGEVGLTFVTTVRTNTESYVINYQEETNA